MAFPGVFRPSAVQSSGLPYHGGYSPSKGGGLVEDEEDGDDEGDYDVDSIYGVNEDFG